MRKSWKLLLLLCFFLAIAIGFVSQANAQEPLAEDYDPPSTCLPTDPDYDPRLCVPIDGGLAVLLIAGVAYGVKKYSWQKKLQNEDADILQK